MRNPFGKKEEETVPDAPALLPLTPEYKEELHGLYFGAIEHALDGDTGGEIKNIALTGSYGVGKSSILQKVAEKHASKAVSISLSTLGFVDDAPVADGVARTAASKTNRIQKEIVKQLLYSRDPVKMPGSRYRRVSRFRFWRELGFSLVAAVPITLTFFLAGWSASLGALVRLPKDAVDWMNLIVFGLAALFVLGLRKIFHNRIWIEKITAGAATIALSSQSATYFDEYLDEIVYFFELTECDLVIFEDIDRFDDAHIFETLRSLNTLLNGAKQLNGRDIRFVYAIKDSIFDELGARAAEEERQHDGDLTPEQDDAAEAEVARANRTKFFDLVIPVVPFITHRSARDLLVSTLGDLGKDVSTDLIDLAARHVADMRLIKNIRNEFAIFRERIIVGGSLDLRDDALFAMMLYKSTHLSDFELIKVGKSDLDLLYADGRKMVSAEIGERNRRIRLARQELKAVKVPAERPTQMAERLEIKINQVLRPVDAGGVGPTWELGGTNYDADARRTIGFWEKLAEEAAQLTITYRANSPWGAHGTNMTFTRGQLQDLLDEPINPTSWAEAERARLEQIIRAAEADRQFLAHADMSALASRAEFVFDGKPFRDHVQSRLKSDLARRLVEAGYIDRNFTLYTSTFYAERVSAQATNFILKHVDPNEPDLYYELSEDDVAAVLRERGRSILRESVAYNVSILDYLLAKDDEGAEEMVAQLAIYGDAEREFLLAYFDSGQYRDELISRLADTWDHTFVFLISEARVDDAERLALVDSALALTNGSVEYRVNDEVADYLRSNYSKMTSFTTTELPDDQIDVVTDLLGRAGIPLPSIVGLSEKLRAGVVEKGLWDVSRPNIEAALPGERPDIALDSIKSGSKAVFDRVVGDLSAYTAALRASDHALADPGSFADVVNAIAAEDLDQLPLFLDRVDKRTSMADLANVDEDAWPRLAERRQFALTLNNVVAYIESYGVDAGLSKYLESVKITPVDDVENSKREQVALAILGASEFIPSAETRARLTASLELDEYLDPDVLPAEAGELIGRLLQFDVVKDTSEAFDLIGAEDWVGRELAIGESTEFASFMTTTYLPPKYVAAAVSSSRVTTAVKDAVIDRFAEFTAGLKPEALAVMADYALAHAKVLPLSEVTRLAAAGVGSGRVLALLHPLLKTCMLPDLVEVLNALGGEHAKLAGATGKHPSFHHSPELDALVERLDALGVVSSTTELGDTIKVNMKQG